MSIEKAIIDFAFYLEGSLRYKKVKGFVKNLLTNDDYPLKRYFDFFMIFLIITSVVIIIEEVTTPIAKWLYYYDVYFVTGIFIVEYLLRMWVHDDIHKIVIEEYEEALFLERPFDLKSVAKRVALRKWEYISSPLAIIDLLAILPSYRELRILRVFVLFRVFKLLRYSQNITHFFQVLTSKKSELFTLLMLVAFTILVSGISLYVFEERANPNINHLFDAFYWSLVTISTVGYGDITPQTHEGRIITMIIILSGVGLISFATSIIVSAFSERLKEMRYERVLNSIRRVDGLYIICGYTNMSELLVQRLKEEGKEFLIIDMDKEIVEDLLAKGYKAIAADATKKETFRHLNFDRVAAVLALTDSDMHNIYICLNIRSFSKEVYLISRTIDFHSYKKLRLAGANYLISPYITAGLFSSKIIEQPIAIEAINDILNSKRNAVCDQIEVVKESFLVGKRIDQIDFRGFKLLLLGVVRYDPEAKLEELRQRFFFNPPDDFMLQEGDVLVVVGYNVSITGFKSFVIESSLEHAE